MGNSGKTIWENVIVIVLIGIIAIFLAPIIENMIYKAKVSSATTSANILVSQANIIYTRLNMTRTVGLPFMIDFNDDNTYDIYEDIVITARNKKMDGVKKLPDKGSIVIDKGMQVSVRNLSYGDVVCNMKKNSTMKCIRRVKTAK